MGVLPPGQGDHSSVVVIHTPSGIAFQLQVMGQSL